MRSAPSPGSKAFPRFRHRRPTPLHATNRESIRAFLEEDAIGNAIVWDRVFEQADYEVYAGGEPPRGVMAVHRARSSRGANFIAIAARGADAAGRPGAAVPRGFTPRHLTAASPP